jgi:uncharacterized protein (TIRG00374 family)
MKKLILGIIISSIFIYFSLKNINFEDFWIALQGKSYRWIFPTVFVFFSVQVLRSMRWGVILSPIREMDQKTLFPIACVGYGAIIVFPMRLGEIVRPYLIHLKKSIPMDSGIGSIFMERFMDIFMLAGFLFYILTQISLPPWITRSGYIFLAMIIFGFTLMILSVLKPVVIGKVIYRIVSRLPQKLSSKVEKFILNFLDGFKVIRNMNKVIHILWLSFLIWFLSACAVYLLFILFHFPFGIIEAMAITVITALGVSIPAAPGLIGNFHFACMIPLTLWSITKADAFAFATSFYLAGIGTNIFLALIFLPSMNVPLSQLLKSINLQKK